MSENVDELSPFMGNVVSIDVYGRLIALSEQFLTIEQQDGTLTQIPRNAVVRVERDLSAEYEDTQDNHVESVRSGIGIGIAYNR